MTAVADLSRTAVGQFDEVDLLVRLAQVAADHLSVDGAGVMVAREDGLCFAHAHARHAPVADFEQVERLQELLQQGPCHDAMVEGRVVDVDDLDRCPVEAWGSYLRMAREVGLGAVVALPLVARGRTWGVLDLYRRRPGPWDADAIAAARVLADVAVSYLVMVADRDQARRAQRELSHRNLHDHLTGLPNRSLLFDRLEHALTVAARHDRTVAVFFVDLDRFKGVNDTFGHAAGDAVLVEAARRMAATVRAEDTLARLAGDEFVLVCENLPQHSRDQLADQLDDVTSRLHRVLAEPIRVADTALTLTASIGVALGDHPVSADDLLADADAAMYRVKQRHTHVERASPTGVGSRHQLERELAHAVGHDELEVHYQPIVSTSGTRATVRAVEALLRWNHPVRGLLVARDFIDIVDSSGFIVPVGHWVIEQTCAQLRRWSDLLGERAPHTAYVNLSRRQLWDPTLSAAVAASLARHDLTPSRLGFELVEQNFADPESAGALRRCHEQGHPLAVDDFGTGYSSLSRLVELPVDSAKIDRSFVAGIGRDQRREALIEAVIVVAGSLRLDIVAEGVETAEQARHLTDAGCDLQQGRYHGAPDTALALTSAWG